MLDNDKIINVLIDNGLDDPVKFIESKDSAKLEDVLEVVKAAKILSSIGDLFIEEFTERMNNMLMSGTIPTNDIFAVELNKVNKKWVGFVDECLNRNIDVFNRNGFREMFISRFPDTSAEIIWED